MLPFLKFLRTSSFSKDYYRSKSGTGDKYIEDGPLDNVLYCLSCVKVRRRSISSALESNPPHSLGKKSEPVVRETVRRDLSEYVMRC